MSQEALERDVRRLQAQWEVVKEKAEQTGPSKPKAPALLYEEPDLLIKVVRDQFNEDFSRLVVAGRRRVGDRVELRRRTSRPSWPTAAAPPRRDRATSSSEYRIDEQLLKALDRKVWLPSGGTLVIDRTEAMTVIDVNTGKFTGSGGNLEETVTRNNLEAAEEIVRQLRLRDIGGIIVIDFIDMVLEANRDLVLRRLTECLARDRTRHQVAEVTSLGLVQMTRKRVGGGLLEHFSTPCEHCRGRGVIVTTEPAAESNGRDRGERDGAAEPGGRRSRGRGRRDDTNGDRGRRLPAVIVPDLPGSTERDEPAPAVPEEPASVPPDRGEASLDVGAPAPAEPAPAASAVAAATMEDVRDDVEEVVVEQALAAERNRHSAPNGRVGDRGPGSVPAADETVGTNGVAVAAAGPATGSGGQAAARPRDADRRRAGADGGRRPRRHGRHGARRASRRRGGRAAAAVDPRAVDPDAVDPRTVERRGLVLRAAGRRPARRELRPLNRRRRRGGSAAGDGAAGAAGPAYGVAPGRPACARGVRYGGRRRGGAAVTAAADSCGDSCSSRERGRPGLTLTKAVPYPGDLRRAH